MAQKKITRSERIIGEIEGDIKRARLLEQEAFPRMGFTKSTWQRRKKNPNTFTLGEINRMAASGILRDETLRTIIGL